jgi:hypothetical protein
LITSQHREMPRNLPHDSAAKAGMTLVAKELGKWPSPSCQKNLVVTSWGPR